ncbi:MAG: hypothetical protein Q4E76_05795 [Tissierellia bacterium]|nr:hypothetical protein [Tissierellia bacterium]
MGVEDLRNDIMVGQKKGLPFILASVVIWLLIFGVGLLDLPLPLGNLLVFCCSAPLLPISWLLGRRMGVDIFSKEHQLGQLGLLFSVNQLLYLLIVMWVFRAVPEKMVMVYAMVFGAHLLPFSWLYKSRAYLFFAVAIPILALILGSLFQGTVVAGALVLVELVFAWLLRGEVLALGARA